MPSSDTRFDAPSLVLGAGTFYTLLAAAGFSAVSTLTSIALAQGMTLSAVLWWRYALGVVVMVAVLGVSRLPLLPRSDALAWLTLGGGGQALLVGLALSSLRFIDVATLAFLFYTYPAWVTVVQTVRGAERLSVARVAALLLSFGGVVLISGRPGAGAVAWQGVVLALAAALVYGGYIPLMQRMQKTHSVLVTSTYAKIGSAVCFLVLAGGPAALTLALSRTAWLTILALTIFSTVLPGVFFLMGLMRLGPVRTAIVSTVEPFLTAALGLVVLHQPVTLALLLGGAMIVAAVITLQLPRERVA
jgi:drug/metabolite transporter (DMT)-like permease